MIAITAATFAVADRCDSRRAYRLLQCRMLYLTVAVASEGI